MATLSKAEILRAQDLPVEAVPVPEWGGGVYVKTLSAEELDQLEEAIFVSNGSDTKVNLQNLRANICARCIVDEKGNRIFTDADAAALGKKSGPALNRIFAAARALNRLRDRDLEELAKNCKSGPGAASSSSSAGPSTTADPTSSSAASAAGNSTSGAPSIPSSPGAKGA